MNHGQLRSHETSKGPRFLIRDNDNKHGVSFAAVAAGTGIEVLRTPYEAPKTNAHCERFVGSVRRECLDFFLILSERHLKRVMKEYQEYFNDARPHLGIEQRIPCQPEREDESPAVCPILRGWHLVFRESCLTFSTPVAVRK